MAEPRKAVRQAISDLLWKIQELEATVCEFNGDQSLLQTRLAAYTAQLDKLGAVASVSDVSIPTELLTYIEEGGNPDSYTAVVFNRANRANQYSKGKTEALQRFRESLKAELKTKYPEHSETFDKLKGPVQNPDTKQP